jgi:ribosomal-protein-alanine N-acetyltransferase
MYDNQYMEKLFVENEQILLRDVFEKDIDDILKWKKDPFVRKMALDYDSEITYENQQEDMQKAIKSDSEMYFIIELKEDKKSIGYVRINWLNKKKQHAWLRFALGEEREKGYAKQVLNLLCRELFRGDCHRIEAETYEFNKASRHVLESTGFKKEGVKRKAHFDGKRYYDIIVYGLLKNEFNVGVF